MFKYYSIFSFFTDIIIKLSIGIVFFNYGYVKLRNLINDESESLINMVSNIIIFVLYTFFMYFFHAIRMYLKYM